MLLDDVEIKSQAGENMAVMELMVINRINTKVQDSW